MQKSRQILFVKTVRKYDKTINGHTEVFNAWLNHHSNENFYCNDMQFYHTIINKNIKINIKYSSRQHHRLTKNAFFMNQYLNDLKNKKMLTLSPSHPPPFFFLISNLSKALQVSR